MIVRLSILYQTTILLSIPNFRGRHNGRYRGHTRRANSQQTALVNAVDLCYNKRMEHTLNPKEIHYIFDDFVKTRECKLALSLTPSDYPWGLEPDGKTLHVDPKEMAAMPDWAGILYLLYNLTRAWLVSDPESAPKAARTTVCYDLREDGRVYKLQDGKWLGARIPANSRASKSLPAHVWAVEEAMAEAEELMTTEWEKDNLHSLAYMMQTGNPLSKEELDRLVEVLEQACK